MSSDIQHQIDTSTRNFGRILVLVAHPDDESLACAALLQRATSALVIFAVDGAPPHYGFEKRFGSLHQYSIVRFQEASRALGPIPTCSFQRLTLSDGAYFVDQHLFFKLPEAFASLSQIASQYSPDLLVSHAFEGGHLDHDACHILANRLAQSLNLPALEFPLYWRSLDGRDVFQKFRHKRPDEFAVRLSDQELALKQRMLAEYRTQRQLTNVFHPETEIFRPAIPSLISTPTWSSYPFQNRRRLWNAALFFQKVSEFQRMPPGNFETRRASDMLMANPAFPIRPGR